MEYAHTFCFALFWNVFFLPIHVGFMGPLALLFRVASLVLEQSSYPSSYEWELERVETMPMEMSLQSI